MGRLVVCGCCQQLASLAIGWADPTQTTFPPGRDTHLRLSTHLGSTQRGLGRIQNLVAICLHLLHPSLRCIQYAVCHILCSLDDVSNPAPVTPGRRDAFDGAPS